MPSSAEMARRLRKTRMGDELPDDLTHVLNQARGGERAAVADLLPAVYQELRRLAADLFRQERADHSLQPTALVHEAWLRLMDGRPGAWESREHFLRAAAVVMRHILVNHARDRRRHKRGGQRTRLPLDDTLLAYEDRAIDLLALDDALTKLAAVEPRQAEAVELRFFGGLSVEETAEVLGVSKRTAEGDWTLARAWLLRELGGGREDER